MILYVLVRNIVTQQFSGCSSQDLLRDTHPGVTVIKYARSVLTLKIVSAVDSHGKLGTEATGVPTQGLLFSRTKAFSAESCM